MSDRHFHLKLDATYTGDKNEVGDLDVEVLHDGQWEPVELGIRSPGFLLYINALFTCQHLYMRNNCAERDLVLASAQGELEVNARKNWEITSIEVTFSAKARSGTATQDDLDYITERMRHCPVSTNLAAQVKLDIHVSLE
jgi:hypothetical protein